MASRFVLALACFALCHSRQVPLNGYVYRDGRSFSLGQAHGGNRATGSASINGGVAQAFGSASNDNQYARNGYSEVYPGRLGAQANAVAEAQPPPTFYAAPEPANIVSPKQYFAVPSQGSYRSQVPSAIAAQSTAVVNDNSESSVSSVKSDGSGSAQSSAQTGSYGVTSTKANTFGSGIGSAVSNANTAYGSTVTSAKTQGYGVANSKSQGERGLTSAQSQSNGGYGSASSTINNAQDSAVATANSQGYGSAASNANINNVNRATTSAKTNTQQGKGWRFGLLYGTPLIQSVPYNNEYDSVNSVADIGYRSIKSTANSQGAGSATANADVNSAGAVKTTANTNGYGSATSTANTGSAFGTFKSYVPFGLNRSAVNAQTSGTGTATSSISGQGVQSGYRVINSSANSSGYGRAQSNAQSL